jgi:hypothetical protein
MSSVSMTKGTDPASMLTRVKGPHEADALMQIDTMVWGGGPSASDNASSILKGAQVLRISHDERDRDWGEVLRHYYEIGFDSYATDTEYRDINLVKGISSIPSGRSSFGRSDKEVDANLDLADGRGKIANEIGGGTGERIRISLAK